jgi:glycosyltransferase involved in cell wall biosynthesis
MTVPAVPIDDLAARDEALDIVVLASQAWESHWCTPQQIASRLAKQARVLYVEPPRSPLWKLRGLATHSARPAGLQQPLPGLWVQSLPAWTLPIHLFSRWPVLRRLNQALIARWVRQAMQQLGMQRPVVWAYQITHEGSPLLREASLSVYDCIDDWPGGASSPHYRDYYSGLDEALCTSVDLLFLGSRQLANSRARLNACHQLVPQGVDLAAFLPPAQGFEVPPALARLPGPRIGLVGVLNAERVDVALIGYLARQRPQWSIVLIGPVWKGLDEAALRQHPNVHLLGNQPKESLGAFLAGLDVCMLPYLLNDFTRAIFPLKLYEYLASGKPFVSTPIPACEEFPGLIRTAATPQDFLLAVEQAMAEDSAELRDARQHAARQNDWEQLAERKLQTVRARRAQRPQGRASARPGQVAWHSSP